MSSMTDRHRIHGPVESSVRRNDLRHDGSKGDLEVTEFPPSPRFSGTNDRVSATQQESGRRMK